MTFAHREFLRTTTAIDPLLPAEIDEADVYPLCLRSQERLACDYVHRLSATPDQFPEWSEGDATTSRIIGLNISPTIGATTMFYYRSIEFRLHTIYRCVRKSAIIAKPAAIERNSSPN